MSFADILKYAALTAAVTLSACVKAWVTHDCPAGTVRVGVRCARVCVSSADCRATEICTGGVCSDSPPAITSVDGDGTPDGAPGHTTHALAHNLIIEGLNLSGAAVSLNGTPLTVCSSKDDGTELTVELPAALDLSDGQYTLTVATQAGTCSAALPTLVGPPRTSIDGLGGGTINGGFAVHSDTALVNSGDLTGTGTPIDGTDQGGAMVAAAAFDHNPATSWVANSLGPDWIGYDFGAGKSQAVNAYSIQARHSAYTQSPSDFHLEGSDTGAWAGEEAILDSQTGVSWTSAVQVQSFTFSNATAYRYYRLNITGVMSAWNVGVGALVLSNMALGTGVTLQVTPTGDVGIGTITPTSRLQVTGLPVHATNAAAKAAGLTAGAFYRTGSDPDIVCVVH